MADQTLNGINLTTLNKTVTAIAHESALGHCKFRAKNTWIAATQNCSTISTFYANGQEMAHPHSFQLKADEPMMLAGTDQHPNPVEHLLNALAGCITTSMVAHAAVQGIEIDALESELEGDIDLNGFLGLAPDVPKGFTEIRIRFKVKTDPANLPKLRELAAFSPVYNTIVQGTTVHIDLESQ